MADELPERLLEVLDRIAQSLEAIEQELRLWREAGLSVNERRTPEEENSAKASETDSEVTSREEQPFPEDLLRSWLGVRGLTLQHVTHLNLEEEPWDWFARFLGNRFEHLCSFYERWKRALSLRQSFSLELRTAPPQQISDIVQFALRLKEASLIVDYQYYRSARMIRVMPAFSSDIIKFVTGGWLERYVGRLLWDMVKEMSLNPAQFFVFLNIQLLLPNQQQTELDLLALYQNQALWLESKTGDYSSSVERWQQNSVYLQLPATHAGIVLLEFPSPTAQQMLKQRTGMQVLSLNTLPEFLRNVMQSWITQTA